eukprot:1156896-Pelagomonas_calceolata.AAC.9
MRWVARTTHTFKCSAEARKLPSSDSGTKDMKVLGFFAGCSFTAAAAAAIAALTAHVIPLTCMLCHRCTGNTC